MTKSKFKLLKALSLLLIFNIILLTCFTVFSQSGAAINTSGAVAHSSAILDVSSSNQGILIPRMTKAQKQAIPLPIATGLMIYQTDSTTGFWYYNGTAWVQSIGIVGATGATGQDGAAGATGPLVSGTTGQTLRHDGTGWVANSTLHNTGVNIGIGTNNPEPTALIDLNSTTKGTLITRMNTTERDAILNPAEGLQIFNTTTKCFECYIYGLWQKLSCGFNCGVDNVNFIYNNSSVSYGTVSGNYNNGQYCWLDRNLGASAVATIVAHTDGYGDLFQWGRLDDGHQVRTPLSGTTSTQSNATNPGHSKFIQGSTNWYSGLNPDNLWQGVTGINNPCPSGWRIPNKTEFDNELSTWATNGGKNYNGAIASPLRLSATGTRLSGSGNPYGVGTNGYYWSFTVYNNKAYLLFFTSIDAYTGTDERALGMSVRCIRDY